MNKYALLLKGAGGMKDMEIEAELYDLSDGFVSFLKDRGLGVPEKFLSYRSEEVKFVGEVSE